MAIVLSLTGAAFCQSLSTSGGRPSLGIPLEGDAKAPPGPQSEDPKAQARRDAKRIDDQYQSATKRSSWATTPKPLSDPWQTVKSPPAADKK